MKRKVLSICLLVFAALFFSSSLYSQTAEVTVGNVRWGDVDFKGFTLTDQAKVRISGEGAVFGRWDDYGFYYGWILNSETRDVVWNLLDSRDLDDDEGIFDFDEEITLEKGEYEVYYAAMDNNYNGNFDLGDIFRGIFGGSRKHISRQDRDELKMNVSGPAGIFRSTNGTEVVDKMAEDAIVSFVRTRDDEYLKKGFSLSGDTKIQIYAIGEGRRSDSNDYGWIYDVKNSKRVWTMNPRFSDNAGGGEKNFLVDEEITLPAGSYMVYYVTDDSHSYEEWNVLPPNDPQFWGITLWAVSKDEMKKVQPFKDVDQEKPVVEIVKVRDDRMLSQGMKLEKDMDLRILCLGEEGNGDMADYGWIVNADTRETVWEMEDHDTEHAGGADKNRMVDKIIHLKKGSYIIYYTTDGSHSYNDWNSSPPYDIERWGITLWTTEENDNKYVRSFNEDEYKSENVIAQIVRVRDDEFIKKSFSLDKDTKIRIIAIGEGTRSRMVDYGWIKNEDTRQVVWEMTYKKTEHAGGASKNREFNGTLLLPKGSYILYYETDGSHSYRDWNSTPPRNPEMYGITILLEK